jgi:hypothetical protein
MTSLVLGFISRDVPSDGSARDRARTNLCSLSEVSDPYQAEAVPPKDLPL